MKFSSTGMSGLNSQYFLYLNTIYFSAQQFFKLNIVYIWILDFNSHRRFDYISLELEHWTWIHLCRYYISCKFRYCLQCTTISRVISCIIDRIWFVFVIKIFPSYFFPFIVSFSNLILSFLHRVQNIRL